MLCLISNASGSVLQTYINFIEQRLKFSHFESSIIPKEINSLISKRMLNIDLKVTIDKSGGLKTFIF